MNFLGFAEFGMNFTAMRIEVRNIINFSPSAKYPRRKPSRQLANLDHHLPQIKLNSIYDTNSIARSAQIQHNIPHNPVLYIARSSRPI